MKPTPICGLLPILILLLAACSEDQARQMTGTLERNRIELVVESDEPIQKIFHEDGVELTAGDVVLQQQTRRFDTAIQEAEAQRDMADARLRELQTGPRTEDIEQARAELKARQALTRNASDDFERQKTLFAKGLGEAQTRDRSLALLDDARAREQAQTQVLERLLNGTRIEELEQAEAELRLRTATLARAQLNRERLQVVAPVDGLLEKVWFEVGERPRPGETVAVMLDSGTPYARIYVPEPLRSRVQPGTELKVSVDGTSQLFTGRVRWVSSDASFTPYFALTEHDRSRLSYLAEVDMPEAARLPSGVPLVAWLP